MKKVAIFIGTRPEGIKMAPVIKALENAPGFQPVVISTGQHREMLNQVIEIFHLSIDEDLAVMMPDQTLASLTARLMQRIDAILEKHQPDIALVQGDTTTVLTASLACFYRQIPVGHVEAGLRTGDISSPFPEEANRKLAATLATLHFAPTVVSENNLLHEHVPAEKVVVTGNTVIDALLLERQNQEDDADHSIRDGIDQSLAEYLPTDWRNAPYVLITGHRRENFGQGFLQICKAMAELAQRFPEVLFIYPVHLNPHVQQPVNEILADIENVLLIPPQGYRNFVALMANSKMILTDSGGVQEEAPSLGKPVLVMRDTTERPEGIDAGTVKLVGPNSDRIVEETTRLLSDDVAYASMANAQNPYGDGQAAARIVTALNEYFYDTSDDAVSIGSDA